jgi:preprotein translocase subunit SecG
MLSTFVNIVHIFVCLVLMFVVLLQQGKGGGMGGAFGGTSAQVFGGSGAGNILTRATAICAGIFMLTSVTLAYMSSSGDRALRTKVAEEQAKTKDQGTKREKTAAPPASGSSASSGGSMMDMPMAPASGGSSGSAPAP